MLLFSEYAAPMPSVRQAVPVLAVSPDSEEVSDGPSGLLSRGSCRPVRLVLHLPRRTAGWCAGLDGDALPPVSADNTYHFARLRHRRRLPPLAHIPTHSERET